jgi:glutamine amidotransferase
VTTVAIIDSGGANIASLQFALERLGVSSRLTADPGELRAASRVLLPGVGAAGDAMRRLELLGLVDVIPRLEQPVLGICLGMQLLYESSAEGDVDCLGIVPGRVERFVPAAGLTVPHMGWNQVEPTAPSPLLAGVQGGDYLYFVHSYRAPIGPDSVASCDYGGPFTAVVQRRNFYGTQFHPERSATVGARILANFLELPGCA